MKKVTTQVTKTEYQCDITKKEIQEEDIFTEHYCYIASKEGVKLLPLDMQQEKYVKQLISSIACNRFTIPELFGGTWILWSASYAPVKLQPNETLEQKLYELHRRNCSYDPRYAIFQNGKYLKTVKGKVILEEVS